MIGKKSFEIKLNLTEIHYCRNLQGIYILLVVHELYSSSSTDTKCCIKTKLKKLEVKLILKFF